jgi:EAL domain-containing protein (putative c-di-GMP-specific phosphodiesterase class I)
VEGRQLSVTASLGVSFFNGHEQGGDVDADQLLRQAEQAMVLAKQAGRNRIEVFDAAQERLQRGRQEELQRIADGLSADEFTLHYQPKVNMRSGAVVGVEALIRWQHPQRGLLAPIKFLPLIEGDALAVELDRWVLRTALAQLQRWREAGLNLPVAINASARWLNEPDFLLQLHVALAACPAFQPGDLEIEVLETRALDDLLHVAALVQGCRALGVRVALDDFGTGYSSLAYLKRLGVDTLKVDQGFVRDCLEDPTTWPSWTPCAAWPGPSAVRWWPRGWRPWRTVSACCSSATRRCRATRWRARCSRTSCSTGCSAGARRTTGPAERQATGRSGAEQALAVQRAFAAVARHGAADQVAELVDRRVGDRVVHAVAAALARHQAAALQQGHVARHIGRRAAGQLGEFADLALALAQQVEQAQARGLGQGLEELGHLLQRLGRQRVHRRGRRIFLSTWHGVDCDRHLRICAIA